MEHEEMRKAFEAEFRSRGWGDIDFARDGDPYTRLQTHYAWLGWKAAMAHSCEGKAELVEALRKLCGTPDDPLNGWQGSGGTHEVFACEYCNAKHGDYTKVPHSPTCPIPFASAALSRHGV